MPVTLLSVATQTPASAGPLIAANCQAELLHVAALANNSGGTVMGRSVEEAGSLNARAMPMTSRTPYIARIGPFLHERTASAPAHSTTTA